VGPLQTPLKFGGDRGRVCIVGYVPVRDGNGFAFEGARTADAFSTSLTAPLVFSLCDRLQDADLLGLP
jgi:hypothetical protein